MMGKRLIFAPAIVISLGLSCVFAGTILSATKYAWSDNVGYINFENVEVNDTTLSGFAWSENAGWIKFDPAQGGVSQDGNGDLSGSAWGERLGWIDFDNVTIDIATGQFSGTATGLLAGIITFDCPDYCDVRTDWRPAGTQTCTSWTYSSWSTCSGEQQTRTITSSSPLNCTGGSPVLNQSCTSGSSGGGSSSTSQNDLVKNTPKLDTAPDIPKHVETYDTPLTILPEQSGTYTHGTVVGPIILNIPSDILENKTTFYITPEPLNAENSHLIIEKALNNNTFYDVSAKDQNGNPVRSFSSRIMITLPISKNLQNTTNLGLYWLNETNWQWVLIPDAVFSEDKVIFYVNHLTRFAIFQTKIDPLLPMKKPEPSLPLPVKKTTIPQNTIREIIEPQKPEESVIKKIQHFIQPIIPNFLKPEKTGNDYVEKKSPLLGKNDLEMIWILILFLFGLFIFFRRRKK